MGLFTNDGFAILLFKYKLLIKNLAKVVLPTPKSPCNRTRSPIFNLLENFDAKISRSEIFKIWLFSSIKPSYDIPLRASTKSVFSSDRWFVKLIPGTEASLFLLIDCQICKRKNSLKFPHAYLTLNSIIDYTYLDTVFIIFEYIFKNNHLNNSNYKLPDNYINFKKLILEYNFNN